MTIFAIVWFGSGIVAAALTPFTREDLIEDARVQDGLFFPLYYIGPMIGAFILGPLALLCAVPQIRRK